MKGKEVSNQKEDSLSLTLLICSFFINSRNHTLCRTNFVLNPTVDRQLLPTFYYFSSVFKKNIHYSRGTWVALLVKRPTRGFSPGHDLRVMRSSPMLGSMLTAESAKVSLFLSLSLFLSPSLSLSQINIYFLKAGL